MFREHVVPETWLEIFTPTTPALTPALYVRDVQCRAQLALRMPRSWPMRDPVPLGKSEAQARWQPRNVVGVGAAFFDAPGFLTCTKQAVALARDWPFHGMCLRIDLNPSEVRISDFSFFLKFQSLFCFDFSYFLKIQ
jgi:hypothetical protein